MLALFGFACISITRLNHYFKTPMNLRIAVILNLIVILGIWEVLLTIYRYKQPWYKPLYIPPDDY
jgi:hypothetical protein